MVIRPYPLVIALGLGIQRFSKETHMSSESKFVGVDGCPRGWFSVGFSGSGKYELKLFCLFEDLLKYYATAKIILVDIPIGLPNGAEERSCDKNARKLLRPHPSRVFRTPTRVALKYLAKNPDDRGGSRCKQVEITGKSLSEQTLAIMPKITEVDNLLPLSSDSTPQVREVHPEICFWALNGQQSMCSSKKTKIGIEERLCVLQRVEPRTRQIFGEACSKFRRKDVARDDILGALAAAVTACRGWPDNLQTLPADPQLDGKGFRMEMVFWKP